MWVSVWPPGCLPYSVLFQKLTELGRSSQTQQPEGFFSFHCVTFRVVAYERERARVMVFWGGGARNRHPSVREIGRESEKDQNRQRGEIRREQQGFGGRIERAEWRDAERWGRGRKMVRGWSYCMTGAATRGRIKRIGSESDTAGVQFNIKEIDFLLLNGEHDTFDSFITHRCKYQPTASAAVFFFPFITTFYVIRVNNRLVTTRRTAHASWPVWLCCIKCLHNPRPQQNDVIKPSVCISPHILRAVHPICSAARQGCCWDTEVAVRFDF